MRQIDLIKLYSQMRCLVIDDMADIRVAMSAMLRVFGVQQVDVVANGDQAIEACNNNDYQLVLCDYNLGEGRDGQQLLEELRYRNRLKNTSIFVLITAESSREMVLGALEYQPDDYVTKPITQAILRQRLDRVLLRNRELFGIKKALDEKDYAAVERLCAERLQDNTAYRGACLQIQAEMNLRLHNFDKAEAIFNSVLAERPVLWARLGLGKTQVAKQEFDKAEQNLKEVIANDRRIVEAHDLLAQSYLGRGEAVMAQKAMQNAAEVSPKSVLRQRRLAELAKSNDDTDVFLAASRRVIKTARNSCYESADDYFNLARELTDLSKGKDAVAEKFAKESFEVLDRLGKRPYFDVSADIQSSALKSRTMINQGKPSAAEAFLDRAKTLYENKKDQIKPEVGLDFAQTLIASGDAAAADEVLRTVAERFPNNEKVMAKADAMSTTPKSQEGRKKVADMTKQGIEFYEKRQFSEAINIFKEAINICPGHIGLNLNLIQVLLAEIKTNGPRDEFKALCAAARQRVAHIEANDPQYARYKHLFSQVDDLFH